MPRHLRWPCAFEREHLDALAAIGEEREAFRRFLAEMAPRLHECEYHQVDWRLVAGAATAASEARSTSCGIELADEAGRIATERGADRATVEWAESLFLDPIQITADGHFLNRGQRRVCALTAAGVARCPVLVDVKRPSRLVVQLVVRELVAYWFAGLALSAACRTFIPGQAASASRAACRSASRVSKSLRSLRVNFDPNGSAIWL